MLSALYLFVASVLLSFSLLYLDRSPSIETLSPYECGFEPLSTHHVPFCMKFFLLAILFIVFDVEVCFLFPTLPSSTLVLSLVLILLLGTLYEFSYGGLD